MSRPLQFVKDWTLVIAIAAGIVGYFVYVGIPWLDSTHAVALKAVSVIQPAFIFAMLFLSFLKVSARDIRPCRWHLWLLLIQSLSFVGLACIIMALPHCGLRVVLEGAMVCLICPTATAAAVVTHKLGGNMAHILTYTILINLVSALLIPAMVPFVHPTAGMSVLTSAMLILGKVFPLLLMPLVLAMIVRRLLPGVKRALDRVPDLAYYMWAVALVIAIAVTVRSIMHAQVSMSTQVWIVVVSLASCVLQFWLGRKVGARYSDRVTAGQALGQKNTIFAIWLSYTFFSPVTAVAGGFYCIWHNLANSWQIYRHRIAEQRAKNLRTKGAPR